MAVVDKAGSPHRPLCVALGAKSVGGRTNAAAMTTGDRCLNVHFTDNLPTGPGD